ncbi:MAG TPA: glutathione S-transferase C-terminal domain-containing protein [Baekduia sp.]|nr:glutathione S-transferase C-terminal domain-containing protein [Baekduia sp.]
MSLQSLTRDAEGEFRREEAAFREPVTGGPERYHLYVSPACPWCHRVMILRALAGLQERLPMSFVAPYRDEHGWEFTGDEFSDPVNGWRFMSEAYKASDPSFAGHVSVPVLWDLQEQRIASNESADLILLIDRWGDLGLYPEAQREEIDAINERTYSEINNGVYRAGFAHSQRAYERAFDRLFAALDWADGLLAERRYLAGDDITIADWRLFPTLLRFDSVYHTHFRCNGRLLAQYEHLWPYARALYQQPGVAETVYFDQIKTHYYTTHDELNPKRIIPKGPLDEDWLQPSNR